MDDPGPGPADASIADSAVELPDADLTPDGSTCEIHCDGDSIVPCNGPPAICPLGCVDTKGGIAAHCGAYTPANGFSLTGADAANDVTYSANTSFIFDTDTGSITRCTPRTVLRAADLVDEVAGGVHYTRVTGVGIFSFKSLSVNDDAVIRALGERALVIVSAGDVSLDGGSIRLSAGPRAKSLDEACLGTSTLENDRIHAAPGGAGGAADAPALGSGGGAAGDMAGDGGGGGGFGAAGGVGGRGGGAGGAAFGGMITPLRGGGGGAGGRSGDTACGGVGGGAGGTLQISSRTAIRVFEDEGIMANGAGGGRGAATCGGGGGGAGGLVVLDSPVVVQSGWISARGGGGGAGDCTDGENVAASCMGEGPGSVTYSGFGAVRFPGGTAAAQLDPTRGGAGGGPVDELFGLPGFPTDNTAATGGGGGGGAAGRIFIRTRKAGATLNATRISPPATMGGIDVQ
jgi:hypothetical protein